MLKKLLKYDFKALNRFLLLFHGILLIIAAVGFGLLQLYMNLFKNDDNLNDTAAVILIIFLLVFYAAVIAIGLATSVVIAVRFYKNMFANEGYLTRTLPTKSALILVSKTISAFVWSLIDGLAIIISVAAVLLPLFQAANAHVWDDFWVDMNTSFRHAFGTGFSWPMLIFTLIVMLLISTLHGVITIYCAISLGQLFGTHKILGSIVMYFGLTTVTGILSVALMVPLGSALGDPNALFNIERSPVPFLWLTTLFALVIGTIEYIVTNYLVKKKVNL